MTESFQLTREQLGQITKLLLSHVGGTEDDRRALIELAFFGEPIVDLLTYSGQPITFSVNTVKKLRDYDNEAVPRLLRLLRDNFVGENKQQEIDALLAELTTTDTMRRDTKKALPSDDAPNLDSPLFISYSRRNVDFVNRLRADLGAHGVPYWIDKEGLSPGTPNWERAIRAAIRDSSAILWVVSPAAYESEYVSSELAVAEMYRRKIYPVWADGDNWIACVPLGKHNIQFVDMRGDAYTGGFESLLTALGAAQSELVVPPEPRPEPSGDPRNPYKGLTAFTETDAGDFFGREALVRSLANRLQTQLASNDNRFLAVLGPSGAGKSSVVMAGLIPALKQDAVPGSESWRYLPRMVPGAHPMESFAAALADLMPSVDAQAVLGRLYTIGADYISTVFEMLPAERVVLYIDQFEELFTLAEDDGERQDFISLLTSAATEAHGKLIVLLSMRADFLDAPLNYPQLGTLFDRHNALVQPMSIPELRDAIVKPARLQGVGLAFDDGLVADIVFALRGQDKALAGALPLLQFTLERLYEERDGNRLTRAAYERMGGVSGAIGTHSEAVFSELPEVAQAQLGTVFLPLVNIDEATGEPTRRRALLGSVAVNDDAERLVNAMVAARLLQGGRDGDTVYVEVAHEALLRSWERLVNWITEVRGDLYTLRELRKAAAAWEANNRSRDFLWLGDRGQDAGAMIARLNPDLNDTERAFARPEAEHLLDEIADIDTLHPRRSEISTRLHQLNYTLPGAGLRDDGLPDIVWCDVDVPEKLQGQPIAFQDERGKVYGEFVIKPFSISKYLVTYQQFQAFVEHPNGLKNPEWWRDMPDAHRQREIVDARQPYTNYPCDSVSWYQAVAFGRWLSDEVGYEVRLPTEWEWQWAAQNGIEQREYPWEGAVRDGRRCNTGESGIGRSTAVGMYPHGAAECDALDMAGNLLEWCLNKHEDTSDTAVDDSDALRVLRGGSWNDLHLNARGAYRGDNYPFTRLNAVGFRLVCVRAPSL